MIQAQNTLSLLSTRSSFGTRIHLTFSFIWSVLCAMMLNPSFGQTSAVTDLHAKKTEIGVQVRKQLDKSFSDYVVYDLSDNGRVELKPELGLDLRLSSDLHWDLQLEANDLRASGYSKYFVSKKGLEQQPLETVHTYKGRVNGDSESSVRLGFYGGVVDGFIRTGSEHYFIEPLQAYLSDEKSSGKVVVYRAKDVKSTASSYCAARAIKDAEGSVKSNNPDHPGYHSRTDSCRVMQLILVADYSFYNAYRSNTGRRILHVLNMVEEVYQRSLGISFEVTRLTIYHTEEGFGDQDQISMEAFSDYVNSTYVEMVGDYPNHTYLGVPRNVAMLFTDRRIDDPNADIPSWAVQDGQNEGKACSLGYSSRSHIIVSHVGRSISVNREARLVAHEIGHSLMMEHEYANCDNGSIGCPGMGSYGLNHFSPLNIARMNFYLELKDQCLTRSIRPYEIVREDMWYQRVPASVEVTNIGPNYASPGSRVRYVAGEQVVLRPGFHAAHGSDFEANIGEVVCAANNRMADPQETEDTSGKPLLYPNPSTGRFHVKMSRQSAAQVPSLSVRDQLGRTVQYRVTASHSATHWQFELDFSDYPKGIYLVGLTTGGRIWVKKMVVTD